MDSVTKIMSALIGYLFSLFLIFGITQLNAQTVETFNFTGAPQQWVVPNCVTSITVVVAGAEGGGIAGGDGAVITSVVQVTPGQVISINVGGQGGAGMAGYGGGGTGHLSMDGNLAVASHGGGGASTVSIGGNPIIIAAGGGGTGGGTDNIAGGAGGCATGLAGADSFGFGGGGATQFAGGQAGLPWNAVPPGGQAGLFGQGGFGGPWNSASGGGGGGGLFGGGGGGNDGCCPNDNGGGGGGGGSSLVPAGDLCNAGANTGNGFITITYNEGVAPTAANSGPYCTNDTIELIGGIDGGNVDFMWTGPNGFISTDQNPTISTATAAMAGIYTLMVTGNAACNDTLYASTEVIVNITPTMNPITDRALCNGELVNIGNFTGSNPTATYSWTNSAVEIGLAQTGNGTILPFTGTAGNIDVTGTIIVTPSDNGCVGTADTFLITVFRAPTLNVSNDTTICQNGTVNLVAQVADPGNWAYDYHWGHTANTQGELVENPTISTTYFVYTENQNGCASDTMEIDVTVREPLSGVISDWDTICPFTEVSISANVSGGMGEPYTFNWSTGASYTGNDTDLINLSPETTQNYSVTISDECESTPLVLLTNVYVSPIPVPDFTILNPEQCEPAIFEVVNATDPSLSQQVNWVVNGTDFYFDQDTISTVELWGGTYDLQMIVTSFEGCVDSITVTDALNVNFQPQAAFHFSPNPATMFNSEVSFQNNSLNAQSYQWNFQDGAPNYSEQYDVNVQFPEGTEGEYQVMLIAVSDLGCADTSIQTVLVLPEVLLYVPNSFTPDGDEFNQTWNVFAEGIDVQDFELSVYNRWGEIIWQSNDMRAGWDGTYRGTIVQTGVYLWKMEYTSAVNAQKKVMTGHVNLIK